MRCFLQAVALFRFYHYITKTILTQMQINPLTLKKINRFRSIRRGYYSFVVLMIAVLFSLSAELFINKRAVMVHYEGRYYFPAYGEMIPGDTFGLNYEYETDYKSLKRRFEKENSGNWVLMPVIPYDPFESDFRDLDYPPYPPSLKDRHIFGTDIVGRDVFARLVYGFRISFSFSLALLAMNYLIGISAGCGMGYAGGKFDLLFQRVIEIWTNIPILYVVIILSSILGADFMLLVLIMAAFGWTSITWTMRTVTYKEKAREYVIAAKALGASDFRIVFLHIIPNTVSLIITYIPFSISSGIVALTALDYLGFGLPPPTPSWGELLQQGWENMNAWWIVGSVVAFMIATLLMVTFIGEAVREAFDPKLHTTYE